MATTERHANTLALQARGAATKELVKRHQEEFDRLHGDAREQLGLTRETGGMSPEARKAKIDKHLEALQKLGFEIPTNDN